MTTVEEKDACALEELAATRELEAERLINERRCNLGDSTAPPGPVATAYLAEAATMRRAAAVLRVKGRLVEALEAVLIETGNAAVYLTQGTTSAISGPLTRIDATVAAALKAAKETP